MSAPNGVTPYHPRPATVVVDLDSTLADTRQRRAHCPTINPKATWEEYATKAGFDTPIAATATLVRLLADAGFGIHILTWRPDTVRELTATWLRRHQIPYHRLRMRDADYTDDNSTAFKVDYLTEIRAAGFTVVLVIDDWAPAAQVIEDSTGIPALCINPRYNLDGWTHA